MVRQDIFFITNASFVFGGVLLAWGFRAPNAAENFSQTP